MSDPIPPGWYEAIPSDEYGGDEYPIAYWTGAGWLLPGHDHQIEAGAFTAGASTEAPVPVFRLRRAP